jgi:hypothetical protein
MRRPFDFFLAAAAFCVLLLTLSLSYAPPTAKAADLQERCNHCLMKTQAKYDACLAKYPVEEQQRCHDEFNSDISHCHRNFCEQ